MILSHTLVNQTVSFLKKYCPQEPTIGLVLGSGWQKISEKLSIHTRLPYADIPHFKNTTATGHRGSLLWGSLHHIPLVILQGRLHSYEGYHPSEIVFPIHCLHGLGVKTIILTNAAGGLNPSYQTGDLMLIQDHINLLGDNPLKSSYHSLSSSPCFLDQTKTWEEHLRKIILKTAKNLSLPLHQGVYGAVLGPTYETSAEVRMLQKLGIDAIGMSTVFEAITAHFLKMKVIGLSCISNLGAGMTSACLDHENILQETQKTVDQAFALFNDCFPYLV